MRITKKHLQAKIDTVNHLLFNSTETHTIGEDKSLKPIVGRFILSQAYGGYDVCSYANEGGGVHSYLHGHGPAREANEFLRGFISALQVKKDLEQ